jgi:hypothetical protein
MTLKSIAKKLINIILQPFGFSFLRSIYLTDYHLHKYSSYEEYKRIQVHFNKVKLNNVFADEATLIRVKNILFDEFGKKKKIFGICHGSRNGYEQNFLRKLSSKLQVIGTDISETAKNYDNSFQWDFHVTNNDWKGSMDFIYTNSLDQSWQPDVAVETWLSQLKLNGLLIIEHTEVHGPAGASEMDPFGVRPKVMPYVLTMWFGSQISINHSVAKKSKSDLDAYLFVIKKNKNDIKIIKNKISKKCLENL